MTDRYVDLSIVIPIYNSWDSCAEILDKILGFKSDWIEIILVNDASGEKPMLGVFKEKLFNHEKVQIINLKTNVGAARARNIGFIASRGKFVWFIDSDDQVGKDFSLTLDSFRKSSEKDIDLFILNYLVIDESGREYARDVILDSGDESVNYFHEYISASNFSYSQFRSVIWRYIIRRDFLFLNCVFFNDVRLFEDIPYICKLMIKRPKAFVLYGESYRHNRRPHSLSSYLVPSDMDSYYSDVAISSLSILHDLSYELAHDNNHSIVSHLESKLRVNIYFILFSLPFLEITSLHDQQWKDLTLSAKQHRVDILRDSSMLIEDNLLAMHNAFNKFITNTVCHMAKSSSVGIYCVSMFSVGCAKLLIETGFNVKCFFDKQYLLDVIIDDMKFPVNNSSNDSISNLNLDYIIVVNRSRDVCLEILNDIKGKCHGTKNLLTIHMESLASN